MIHKVTKPFSLSSGDKSGRAVFFACIVTIFFAFAFGGASRQHELRLALVILAALPLLVMATDAVLGTPRHKDVSTLALVVLAATMLLPLLQLIPIPPGFWTMLPGRSEQALALEVTGIPPQWTALTLSPDRTWRSFLALLPAAAVFLGGLCCSPEQRVQLVKWILALAALSVCLGVAQIASGGTAFYPWSWTDPTSFTGLFANRNHLATLCLVCIPFLGVLAARPLRRSKDRSTVWVWIGASGMALAVIAIGMGRSRAGIALLFPVTIATLLAFWVGTGRKRPGAPLLALLAGVAISFGALATFALGPIIARFDTTNSQEGRFENWPIVLDAADKYLPLGSGLGSFDRVYRSVEPLGRLDATYFNQAHNDYLETWLEAGWLGAGLLALFVVWFARRTWQAWTSSASTAGDLQRAASIAITAVLIHSSADYPLRTETIMVVFSLCCAILELASRTSHTAEGRKPMPRKLLA